MLQSMKWLELYRMALQRPLAFDTLADYGIAALQSSRKLAQEIASGTRIADLYLLCLVLDAHSVAVPEAVSRGIELACGL
jgi:hypothetical protein